MQLYISVHNEKEEEEYSYTWLSLNLLDIKNDIIASLKLLF